MNDLNLNDLRIAIDDIDSELVSLLEKRMDISKKVGEYKAINNIEVLNIQRELEVIDKISNLVNCKTYENETKDIYFEIMRTSRCLQVSDASQKLNSYGLLGESLKHSISPKIHNSLFNFSNLHERYVLFEIKPEYLKSFMSNIQKYNIKGMNVTIPYKVEVMQYLDIIDEHAKNIGSINTIKINDGVKIGYNTDYYGFEKLLEINNVSVENKIVVILGSGGSSKTVKYYCKQYNAKEVYIVSRNKNNTSHISYDDLITLDFDVLINTTPVGMYPDIDAIPINQDILKQTHDVIDLIYNPVSTKLLQAATEVGCKSAINGELMLYYQGLKAQEIWGLCDCTEENINVIKNEFKNI